MGLTTSQAHGKIKTTKGKGTKKMDYADYERVYGLTVEEYEELGEIIAQQDREEWEEYMAEEQRVKYSLDEQ